VRVRCCLTVALRLVQGVVICGAIARDSQKTRVARFLETSLMARIAARAEASNGSMVASFEPVNFLMYFH